MQPIHSIFSQEIGLSRREALLGLSAAGALATSAPAYAFLGLGEDAGYPGDTQNIIAEIKSVLVLAADDPTKPDRITTLRRAQDLLLGLEVFSCFCSLSSRVLRQMSQFESTAMVRMLKFRIFVPEIFFEFKRPW